VWSYLVRRLLIMIPTLFGVTIVSFCIMQLAPGDPLLTTVGGGTAGASSQTREAYLIQKRDLKLDKPLLLNFRYFRDYSQEIPLASQYMAMSREEILAELPSLMKAKPGSEAARRRDFLRDTAKSIGAKDFDERLRDPQKHVRLARAIEAYVPIYLENIGSYAVPAAINLLKSEDTNLKTKIGTIRALNSMVVESFVYTYSSDPSEAETPAVVATWKTWWERSKGDYTETNDERRQEVRQMVGVMAEASRSELVDLLDEFYEGDVPYLAEILLGESELKEKLISSVGLLKLVGRPLRTDVALDADAGRVADVAANWLMYYEPRQAEFEPALGSKLWYIVADTQYAHMVWRLATFNFGRSTIRTREPVAGRIWAAVKASAPLYLLAQVMIYLVAVPLGVICAVNRAGWADRGISFMLFLLYSIPAYVAGMLFLLFFAYGEFWSLFPMKGLHSSEADKLGFARYLLDYLWHIALPVTCLSLFGLAGLAMYARSSMLDVISQDYIRTARAKGLSNRVVVLKHAMRNSLIPIITLFSNLLPAMLGGSVLIEHVFGIPGVGRLGWSSILQNDYPTLMALIYVEAIVVLLSFLLTDFLYVLVDPRISFEGRGKAA
jgi:peptide/nickel transport system permease protein